VVQEISANGGKAIGFVTDVTKRAEVEALIQKAVDASAASSAPQQRRHYAHPPIEALKVDEWDDRLTSISKDFYMALPLSYSHARSRREVTS